MHTLIIQHISTNPDKFEVVRAKDNKRSLPAVEIPSPSEFPVEGRPDSNLTKELRWYLESFLDYPFEPDTDVAERVQNSLKKWGEAAFNALFNNRNSADMLKDAIQNGYEKLHLKISSDDPRILAWNWEALRDPQAGTFAHLCQIERKLNQILDPVPLSEKLPKDCVNILLVTARPFENDVRYRSISRLLVEMIESQNLPAHVHVLRPPTFDNLREHLKKHPNFYHILHFDGHGYYMYREGCLVLETSDGKQDLILTEQLSALLREHAVPAVVLNAYQSGMIDENAKDPFASVAASLLKSGVRSVAAMAYSLYVSGAQVFLPEFYRMLFETGSMEKAVRAGRQQMFSNPKRVCVRGKFPLQDWLVPVLYQQESSDFSFASQAKPKAAPVSLPSEIADEENPYGFIGRDKAILDLERALRSKSPGILIQGLGGVGKTTLAKGFVKWLSQTQGLGNGCFWFAFNDIRNAESVLNRMGEALFGGNFSLASVDERLNALVSTFKEHRFIIVWDNFESVRGIPGTEVSPMLDNEQQALLALFLKKLRNGQTKVIITSRSEEEWIKLECRKIDMTGLDGEERWLFLNEIVRNLGIRIRQDDPDLVRLIDMLNGHPLSMRVILPMLEKQSAKILITALQTDLDTLLKQEDEENVAKLYAMLGLAQKALPDELRPLLILLGMHERFIHLKMFEDMAKQVNQSWTSDKIRRFADALSHTGLLYDRGHDIYELHPALTGYLRAFILKSDSAQSRNEWTKAFVEAMGAIADILTPKQLHEKRVQFDQFGASFYYAMNEAQRIGLDKHFKAIIQSLAAYALNTQKFKEAADLYLRLAESCQIVGDTEGEAGAYHQIGIIAHERRDFDAAEKWYRKSLEISEKYANEHGAASTYHHLGMIAYGRRDFDAAEKWYRKSLEISEKHANEYGSASTYHQLGVIAEERRDFDTAEKWYWKSLEIKEKYGNEHGAASTYHQLGSIAQERRDFDTAEKWYLKSLEISEKHGNEHGAASTYHQLGIIAEERRDFDTAEKWYLKSLEISEKHGNNYGAATTYGQLGILAGLQGYFEESGRWLIKAILIFSQYNASSEVQRIAQTFMFFYNNVNPETQGKLKAVWEKAGLERLPKYYEQIKTFHQLGMASEDLQLWEQAEFYYQNSLKIKIESDDRRGQAGTYHQLGSISEKKGALEKSQEYYFKALEIYIELKELYTLQIILRCIVRMLRKKCRDDLVSSAFVKLLQIISKEIAESLLNVIIELSNIPSEDVIKVCYESNTLLSEFQKQFHSLERDLIIYEILNDWMPYHHLLESSSILTEHEDEHSSPRFSMLKGIHLFLQEQYYESIQFLENCLTFDTKSPFTVISTYIYIARNYQAIFEFQRARWYWKDAHSIAKHINNSELFSFISVSLAQSEIQTGQIGKARIRLQEIKSRNILRSTVAELLSACEAIEQQKNIVRL